jgi:transcriptional regulator with XRE-family HTH domain
MEYFIDRLEKVLKDKGISKTELAEKNGIRRPTISDWKKNGAVPSGDVCLKIARYLGVSAEWLISGEETKDYIPAEEKKRLSMLRELTPEQRHTIDVLLNDFERINMESFKKDLG